MSLFSFRDKSNAYYERYLRRQHYDIIYYIMFNCHCSSGDVNPGVISSRSIIYIGVW